MGRVVNGDEPREAVEGKDEMLEVAVAYGEKGVLKLVAEAGVGR